MLGIDSFSLILTNFWSIHKIYHFNIFYNFVTVFIFRLYLIISNDSHPKKYFKMNIKDGKRFERTYRIVKMLSKSLCHNLLWKHIQMALIYLLLRVSADIYYKRLSCPSLNIKMYIQFLHIIHSNFVIKGLSQMSKYTE